ncbi:hypothetical protein EDD59_11084 [Muricomes intestini]|uniref:Uncharacterized protein n=1 Tax=Muricomes intestini TaxID=1796634 RepID=A0A4R3K8A2_9FIRM|nr:hypothetical protein EDD59_11084 [Muricomes intestini]
MAALSSQIKKSYTTPPQWRHGFPFSCFITCNRSTSETFYVPIFLSLHSSFSATLFASVLADACNTARSFIATALLNLTHTTFVATAFLPLFLLDIFIRVFVSGSQPHSCHENFIDPRPIDRTIHLWTAFHNSISLFGRFSADFNVLCQLRILHSLASNVVLGERFQALPLHSTLQNIS